MMKRGLVLILLVAMAAGASSRRKKSTAAAGNAPGQFDYYLLTLSWSPEFCATHARDAGSRECAPGRHLGFVVHGLWPQKDEGHWPEACAPARPVASELVQHAMTFMAPDAGLIQHEWERHGTCSGLSPQDYFAVMEKAFRGLQIPAAYRNPAAALSAAPDEMVRDFAAVNHASPDAFRVTCAAGDMVAVEACLTKDLKLRACAANLRGCPARAVRVLPTR